MSLAEDALLEASHTDMQRRLSRLDWGYTYHVVRRGKRHGIP